jgi:oligopeptide transport system substrate-binding protein
LLEDAGKPLPFVDRVVVDIFVERQPMWLNFLAGNLDLSTIPKDNFSSAVVSESSGQRLQEDLIRKGIRLAREPAMDVTHVTFNLGDPVLGKNKLLRQAMSLAYDEATFIDLFYNGRAIPAQGPIPPGISGHDPALKNPYRQFNIAKAKELLAKAGFPGGTDLPVFEYATLADSTSRQVAEYFQKMMSVLGIRIRTSAYSWPQFQEVVRNRKAQLWEQAWLADYPDGENFLQLFYGKNVSPGPNDSGYSNPRYDQLYEKAIRLPDSPRRTAIYREMVGLLVEDCPWIFGSHRLSYVLTQPWMKNYKPNDFDHSRYKYYRVDPTRKKK